jgi:Zn/Cd-binding protein ZinT
LSKVGKEELDSVYPFLQKMNFDNKFEISHA